jgi:hypothetical protein
MLNNDHLVRTMASQQFDSFKACYHAFTLVVQHCLPSRGAPATDDAEIIETLSPGEYEKCL